MLAGAASFDAPLSEAVCASEPPSAMLQSVEGGTARAAASVASGMLAGAASFDGPLSVTSAIDVTSGIAVGTELSCDAPSGEAAHASKLLSEMLLSMVGETAEATVNMTSGIAVGAELSCDAPSGEAARASELLGEMLLSTVGETAKALSSILVSHEPPWIEPKPSEPPSSELSLSEQRRSDLLPIEAPLRALRPSELPTGELSSAEQESSSDAPSGEAICDFELPTELPSSAKVEIVEAAASEAGGKLRSHEPKSERRIASSSVEAPSAASAAAVLLSALGLLQSVVGEAASVPPASERSEVITSRRVEPSSSVSCVVSSLSIELRSHEPKSDRSIASSSVEAICVGSAAAELLSEPVLSQSMAGKAAEAAVSVVRDMLSSVPPASERAEAIASRGVEPSSTASCVASQLSIELQGEASETAKAAVSEVSGTLRSHEPKSEKSFASSSVEAPCVSSAAAELLSALSLLSELSLSVSPSELPLGGPPSEPPLVRSDAPLDEAARASELLNAMLLSAMGEAAEAAVDVRSGVASSVEAPSVASTAVVLQSVASVARGALSNVAPLSFERVKAADVTASGSSERVEQHCNSSLRCEQMTVVLEGAVAPPTRVLVQWLSVKPSLRVRASRHEPADSELVVGVPSELLLSAPLLLGEEPSSDSPSELPSCELPSALVLLSTSPPSKLPLSESSTERTLSVLPSALALLSTSLPSDLPLSESSTVPMLSVLPSSLALLSKSPPSEQPSSVLPSALKVSGCESVCEIEP